MAEVRVVDALQTLRLAVSFGLPGSGVPSGGENPPLTTEVVQRAKGERVLGLLWSALEAGAIDATDQLGLEARDAYLEALHVCLLAEETAVLALDALGSNGIDARALKGIAIAHLDHGDPAERNFGDADILIRRHDYQSALRALAHAGFRRAEPPVRGWWEHRFGKAVVFLSPSGAELDLHLAITGGYFGERIDYDELWRSSSESFQIGGQMVRGLDRESRFLHACCHTVLGGGSGLRAKRDVAQLLLISETDWPTAMALATRNGIDSVVAEAVRRTWSELHLNDDHPAAKWAAAHAADPVQQRALAGYVAAPAQGWAPEGLGMLAALSALDRARFLTGLGFPSRDSLRVRHRTRLQHLRLGVSSMRGGA